MVNLSPGDQAVTVKDLIHHVPVTIVGTKIDNGHIVGFPVLLDEGVQGTIGVLFDDIEYLLGSTLSVPLARILHE